MNQHNRFCNQSIKTQGILLQLRDPNQAIRVQQLYFIINLSCFLTIASSNLVWWTSRDKSCCHSSSWRNQVPKFYLFSYSNISTKKQQSFHMGIRIKSADVYLTITPLSLKTTSIILHKQSNKFHASKFQVSSIPPSSL